MCDYGTLALLVALPRIGSELWSTSRINLLHAFQTNSDNRTVVVRLYKRKIAVIFAEFAKPVACDEHGSQVAKFRMCGIWSESDLGYVIEGYRPGRQLRVVPNGQTFSTTETNASPSKYDCLDALILHEQWPAAR